MSLYTISAIHILMDEFTVDNNLYHSWQCIRPMNVFDHRPKVLSFPIRYHLIVLMLGGQGISKMSIFPLWIWYFFWIGLKEFSRHWCCFCFIKWCYFETYSRFKHFTPIFRPNMKFCIRARNLVIHRCEISKSVWWFNIDRCSKYLSWTDAYLDHKRIIMRMSRCDILLWWICHLPYT